MFSIASMYVITIKAFITCITFYALLRPKEILKAIAFTIPSTAFFYMIYLVVGFLMFFAGSHAPPFSAVALYCILVSILATMVDYLFFINQYRFVNYATIKAVTLLLLANVIAVVLMSLRSYVFEASLI